MCLGESANWGSLAETYMYSSMASLLLLVTDRKTVEECKEGGSVTSSVERLNITKIEKH